MIPVLTPLAAFPARPQFAQTVDDAPPIPRPWEHQVDAELQRPRGGNLAFEIFEAAPVTAAQGIIYTTLYALHLLSK